MPTNEKETKALIVVNLMMGIKEKPATTEFKKHLRLNEVVHCEEDGTI